MHRNIFTFSVVTILITMLFILSTCGQSGVPLINFNEEFSLSQGQIVLIKGEDLKIKFVKITEDSRCPKGATCIWTGEVSCVVELISKGPSQFVTLTEPGLKEGYTEEKFENYIFKFRVTPYPEVGSKIPEENYRLNLIVNKLPELSTIIGKIITDPLLYAGKEILVTGYYRGWDLLHEAGTGPPVTRSDWVIKDSSGAVYVSAQSQAKFPEGLEPYYQESTKAILTVKGIVRINDNGQVYIEAQNIERIY